MIKAVQLGEFRRFGEAGIVYEVLDLLDDTSAKIRVLETGEELEYSLAKIQVDPIEI